MQEQIRQAELRSGVKDTRIPNRPSLPWGLQDYLEAFQQLDRRRQMGYAFPQPLSTSEILGYGLTHGFRSSLQFFFKVISALDDHHLAEQAQKEKARRKSKPKPGGRRK